MSILHPIRKASPPVDEEGRPNAARAVQALLAVLVLSIVVIGLRKAGLVVVPLRHEPTVVDTDMSELRKDPVPGASNEPYTYPEYDFRLMER